MTIQIEGVSPEQLLDLASEFTIRKPSMADSRLDAVRIVRAFQADGSHRWAVYKGYWSPPSVLARDGEWEAEPSPSNRDDDFYDRCRFNEFEDAFRAAERACQADPGEAAWFRRRLPA